MTRNPTAQPPTGSDSDLEALASLSGHLSASLSSIVDHQLTLATPCPDWDLAELVDHVTGGNWFTGRIFTGLGTEDAMAQTIERFGGQSASVEAAISSVAEQLTAFSRPGVLGGTWVHVAGDLTGRQILRLRLHDLIVHFWDIEETLNPPASLPDALVNWAFDELADRDSLTVNHFGLTRLPEPGAPRDASAYLGVFGR